MQLALSGKKGCEAFILCPGIVATLSRFSRGQLPANVSGRDCEVLGHAEAV